MSKFRFRVCRDLTESVMVTVQAETIQEAHAMACADPNTFADKCAGWDGTETSWEPDDSSTSQPYIPDESDFQIIDLNWNVMNQHEKFTHHLWVTAIRMYKTEKGYHDWVEDEIAHGGIE